MSKLDDNMKEIFNLPEEEDAVVEPEVVVDSEKKK